MTDRQIKVVAIVYLLIICGGAVSLAITHASIMVQNQRLMEERQRLIQERGVLITNLVEELNAQRTPR
jgi:hypothetical protein